jgi:uncharacterized protein YjcR
MREMDYVRAQTLARQFGVSSTTVNKWASKYNWERVSFGGPYYVNLNDVRAYVEEHSF